MKHIPARGEAAREMKAILGDAGSTDADEDWEDRLNRVMESRGQQPNLSVYAFTATPKGKTLETFGRKHWGSLCRCIRITLSKRRRSWSNTSADMCANSSEAEVKRW